VSSRNGGRPATPWARGPSHPDWWDAVLGSYKRYAERERMPTLPAATAEVTVDASPEEAFRIFTDEIGLWWRRNTPYRNDAEHGLSVRIEPGMGGRFIEVYDLESGTGFEAGRITAWEPGKRLALTWTQVGWPEGAATEIEVTFEPSGEVTVVRLEQTGFERLGPEAARFLEGYSTGWPQVLGWFAERVDTRTA
jgi:uncharacterized protein YndB with AHSA1/START domain